MGRDTPSGAPAPVREALVLGLADAAGFVGGALAGWQFGRWLGLDVLAPGWDARTIGGWACLLLGCGAGKWASQRWRAARATRLHRP